MRFEAIRKIYPKVISINSEGEENEECFTVGKNGESIPITFELDEVLIAAEITKLQTEYDSTQYQRDRKAEYDKLNQFELISDDAIHGTTTHKDAILAIKIKYPKPI